MSTKRVVEALTLQLYPLRQTVQLPRRSKRTTPAELHVTKSQQIISISFSETDAPPGLSDTTIHSTMPPFISSLTLRTLRTLVQRPAITIPVRPAAASARFFQSQSRLQPVLRTPTVAVAAAAAQAGGIFRRQFSTTPARNATYNQVRRGCRTSQRARRSRSPALVDRPEMKGVCLKTGVTKPKKPNSGERKTARVRLSSGKVVTAYIPGEGTFWSSLNMLGRERKSTQNRKC